MADGTTYALKELPIGPANREFTVLRHLRSLRVPAVRPVGIAESPDRGTAILVTEYLRHSLQYRRLLMRFPLARGPYRDRLLDAMASLLVDLHHAGVYWGDCSLANTLFRRDGERIQAYLVDAETSEVHPSLTDGQRTYDLDILVENVAFGLADLAALQDRPEDVDEAIPAAEGVRERYEVLWSELHDVPAVHPSDRQAIRARIRRLNDLGFAVDEILLERGDGTGEMRLRTVVSNRRFHAAELERLTGLRALEGQARLLLNDVREYTAWLSWYDRRPVDEREGARRWVHEVLEPALGRLVPAIGPTRDAVQAYCDVLEEKWLLSERASRDVGLEAAIAAYLEGGAQAPEAGAGPLATLDLDIDWSGGLDGPAEQPVESGARDPDTRG